MASLSLIMPTYNKRPAYTQAALASLGAWTVYRPIEFIFVDNGSEPRFERDVNEALERMPFPSRAVWLPENRGWIGGCEAGLQRAAGDFIVLLNNDIVVTEGWLAAQMRVMDDYPRVGIVGGVATGDRQWQGLTRLQRRWSELRRVPLGDSPREAHEVNAWLRQHCAGRVRRNEGMVAFFATTLRREMLDEIGFFDPRYGLGFADDDDLCWRARQAHWDIAVALDSLVFHYHRLTWEYRREHEGFDYHALQQRNLALLHYKQQGEQAMKPGSVLKYLGHNGYPFVIGIPARDLTQADLNDLALAGLSKTDVLDTSLYIEVIVGEVFGPSPFCGAPTAAGGRCRRTVSAWGERCYQHPDQEVSNNGSES